MLARRWLLSIVVVLCALRPAAAQGVPLTEAPLTDQCFRHELTMELDGKIKVQQDGKQVEFPHKAHARHVFLERALAAADGLGEKSARVYQAAEAAITFNGKTTRRALRPDRAALMVAHRAGDQLVVYSPKGPLAREEMELTEHFDTLAVPGLLPGKAVAVGASWKLTSAAATLLCDLDGLTDQDLTCTLEAVKENVARVTITGSASGIDLGAQVKTLVTGHFDYDVRQSRVVALEWRQSDQRQQGPVSPALSADVVIKLTRTPIPEPAELNTLALVPVPTGKAPPAGLSNLLYRDPKGRFEFRHPRDWHVVSPDDGDQLVLRLMDRGDFIAQATVTPWKKVDPKAVLSMEEFAELMAKTPGWEEQAQVEAPAEVKDTTFAKLYRVTGTGKLDGVDAYQAFHLLVSPTGEQVIVTITAAPTRAAALGQRDLVLIRNVTFPGAPAPAEAPADAKKE